MNNSTNVSARGTHFYFNVKKENAKTLSYEGSLVFHEGMAVLTSGLTYIRPDASINSPVEMEKDTTQVIISDSQFTVKIEKNRDHLGEMLKEGLDPLTEMGGYVLLNVEKNWDDSVSCTVVKTQSDKLDVWLNVIIPLDSEKPSDYRCDQHFTVYKGRGALSKEPIFKDVNSLKKVVDLQFEEVIF